MQFDELRFVCQQAALDLLRTRGRPLPPTIVLPGPERTSLLTLPDFPDEDEDRHAILVQLAFDRVTTPRVPCWGFVAEAETADGDVVVVVYGARRHPPHLTAARVTGDATLDEFVAEEPLDPTAMPFLHPLQHAVDSLSGEGDVFDLIDPKRATGTAHPGHEPGGHQH